MQRRLITWGLLIAGFFVGAGCDQRQSVPQGPFVSASERVVERFCGDCHASPEPETFPAHRWRHEVEQGFEFYRKSGRTDLELPDLEAIVAYYEREAPEFLKIPLPEPLDAPEGPLEFRVEQFAWPASTTPAISHFNFRLGGGGTDLLIADMRGSLVSRIRPVAETPLAAEVVLEIANPAHIERSDLDGDANEDWLVAALGTFDPSDRKDGALAWVELSRDGEVDRVQPILENVGRVADCRAADFDGDGDEDIVAALFGWRKTGRLVWLEQLPPKGDVLDFKLHPLDARHGCSHVPVVDVDRDGDLDLVALFSQEYETIELFLNDGRGRFDRTTIHQALDPAFGSSSIDLADLDADGDVDILCTNGDSFDSGSMKPYHGVQWLEQQGRLEFVAHRLTDLPGAYCAKAGDLEGDGDLDIVACAMTHNYQHEFTSLIWLEQTATKQFVRRNLRVGRDQHACVELADLDGDGDLDIIAGHFEPRNVIGTPWMTILWNAARRL